MKYKMRDSWNIYDQYVDNCKETLSGWPNNTCGFQSKAGMNDVALIGSSHAGHLFMVYRIWQRGRIIQLHC